MALNRNNLKQSPIPAVSSRMKITNPDGTPTRGGQLLLEQLQNVPSVTGYGVAGGAPTDMPDGSFYVVESGGAEVLYQLQNGEWHYVAGTMWGTLSPDQRPVGLGANDAGFTFRTIDADPAYAPRTFVWSGSTWVETTQVTYGTHASRPAPGDDAPARTLYIETDRGNVIYENQAGAWHYSAGVMTDVLANRPSDLGANDVGFIFTDTNFEGIQYRWTGSAWLAPDHVTISGSRPEFVVKTTGGTTPVRVGKMNGDANTFITFNVFHNGTNWQLDNNAVNGYFILVSSSVFILYLATPTAGAPNIVEIAHIDQNGHYYVQGTQVIGPRLAAIAAPSGGTVIDVQARAAINSILNAMSAAAGGHGLIA